MKKQILLLASAMLLIAAAGQTADKAPAENRFFEMRTYHAAPGKLDEVNARFRDHTVALFAKHDITNIGYWIPSPNPDYVLVYLLAYPSREARDKSWKEFGADPDWQAAQKASEANGRIVLKADSVYLTATDYSPLVQPVKAGEPRVFELRTYHAAPGKMDALNARFRDHTVGVFNKLGMTQFGYWQPVQPKDGAGETLIYILAHKNQEAAAASWKAFQADPDWITARAASEANGPLTTRTNGVKSVFMIPTDYSPTK
jgi:hypothetical protein